MKFLSPIEVALISYLFLISASEGDCGWHLLRSLSPVFFLGPEVSRLRSLRYRAWKNLEMQKRRVNEDQIKALNEFLMRRDYRDKKEDEKKENAKEDDLFFRLFLI